MTAPRQAHRAALLSIGDELCLGQHPDTNSAWLAARLAACGAVVVEMRTVPDDRASIAGAMRELAAHCDVLVATGGLGPTADDVTRDALGDIVDPGRELVLDETALARLERLFTRRSRPMPASNRVQAMRPAHARLLANANGTAPGLAAEIGSCRVFALPGPPAEMMPIFEREIATGMAGSSARVLTEAVHACGIGESDAAERLGALMDRDAEIRVGTTASAASLTARIFAQGDEARLAAGVEAACAAVERAWAPYAFGRGETTLASAMVGALRAHGLTLATAESCTGGLAGAELVDVAGASDVYVGGWVTYSNAMKHALLGVGADVLEEEGAVSSPVALAMARGALERSSADLAVAITGIAGPEGGTPSKPVGTVWIGLVGRDGRAESRRFRFPGDRRLVRDRSAAAALQMIRLRVVAPGADVPLLFETDAPREVRA